MNTYVVPHIVHESKYQVLPPNVFSSYEFLREKRKCIMIFNSCFICLPTAETVSLISAYFQCGPFVIVPFHYFWQWKGTFVQSGWMSLSNANVSFYQNFKAHLPQISKWFERPFPLLWPHIYIYIYSSGTGLSNHFEICGKWALKV